MKLSRDRGRRVVILGGGFGGAYCARELARSQRRADVEIVLIDRHNYLLFYPLLVEAGTGSLEPRHAVVSLRSFLKGCRFIMGEVGDIDVDAGTVSYCPVGSSGTESLHYDHMVVSLGTVTKRPPVPGLAEFAFELKSLADAVILRDHAIEMLELADVTPNEDERRRLLHFVVVGGNFTGAEVAGEFVDFVRAASRMYRHVHAEEVGVTLVEIDRRILNQLDEHLSAYALRQLEKCGAHVRLNETVTRIGPDCADLRSGACLPTRTVIWCAGIAPNPIVQRLPFPKCDRGYLLTERDLRIPEYENVWAIGDIAVNPDPSGQPYPPTAQHAVQEGKHAAQDIARVLAGRPTRPCSIKTKGSLAAIGCRAGVARVLGFKLSGFAAWWLFRTFYLLRMPGIMRKLRVAVDWSLSLVFPRDYVELRLARRRAARLQQSTSEANIP